MQQQINVLSEPRYFAFSIFSLLGLSQFFAGNDKRRDLTKKTFEQLKTVNIKYACFKNVTFVLTRFKITLLGPLGNEGWGRAKRFKKVHYRMQKKYK